MNKYKIAQPLWFARHTDRKAYKGSPVQILIENEMIYYMFEVNTSNGTVQEKIPEEYCFKSKEELDKGLIKLNKYWSTVDAINNKAHETFLKHSTKMFKKVVTRPEFSELIEQESANEQERSTEV
jgi:hypothetical protein